MALCTHYIQQSKKHTDFLHIFTKTFQYEKLFFFIIIQYLDLHHQLALKVSVILIKIGQDFNKLRKGSNIQISLKYAL